MLREEATDALRTHGQLPLLPQVGRQLFETPPGMLDILDQNQDGRLGA